MAEPRFLLDTNILIYLIGGSSDVLRARVEECPNGSLVTSTICVAEASLGLAGESASMAALHRVLGVIAPISFDLRAAFRFAEVPFPRGRSDRLIAAQTLSLGLVLVTNNVKDFVDVPGLRIENWTRP